MHKGSQSELAERVALVWHNLKMQKADAHRLP
jgi:hypothetical protein